jgi:hypothetical protein
MKEGRPDGEVEVTNHGLKQENTNRHEHVERLTCWVKKNHSTVNKFLDE